MPPNKDKQIDRLIRSALVASVKEFQPSDGVWEQIQRKCEATSLDKHSEHHFVGTQRRPLISLSSLPLMLLLRGLGLISEILFTERVALLGYRLEGSTSSMLASL